MPPSTRPDPATPPANLCDLLLRDVAALFATSRLLHQFLRVLRPECRGWPELAESVDDLAAISANGPDRIRPPLGEAGAVLPATIDHTSSALMMGLLIRLPAASPGVLAAEVSIHLRLLAQHLELQTRVAAETAVLLGQNALSYALMAWSAEWRRCGRILRPVTVRARAQAYVADLGVSRLAPAT